MEENTPSGRNLGARVAATDPGDVLTYSLSGVDAVSFDINRATGQLTTKAALNFEMAVDQGANNEYEVTVTATDPFGANDSANVTITVTDVNEDPSVSGAASIDHAENGTELDIDAEAANVQAAEYTATDEDGDDDADTGLTWLLSGADASKFDITDDGAGRTLSFKDDPDYESPGDSGGNNVYEVTVKVTDSKGNSDEQDVTVKVTNMEEPGVVTLSTLQPRVGFPMMATLADPDNITAGSISWQWYKGTVTQQGLASLDGNECVGANANECFIKGATSATYTPVAFDVNDTVVAVVLYTDGSPNDANAKDFAMMVTANNVLADTRNKAPVFPDQDTEMDGDQTDQERSIAENVPAIGDDAATALVRTIGDPVVAMDSIIAPDTGDPTPEILTYSLGGPDADSFTINRETAQLSTKVALDTETKDTYTVTVTATDPSNETATITVTIKVTGVDEAPMIMVGGLTVSGMSGVEYAENGTGMVATYTVSGPDADMATWTLGGDDAGQFSINNGMLMFMTAPDYEMPMDMGGDNMYMVTVMADDETYMDTHDVTVTVTNVDEMGTVTLSAMQPRVGTPIMATVTDDDGDESGVTWQWASSDAMDGTYTDIEDATSASYTPVVGDANMYLRATAMYTDGHGPDKSASAESAQQVTANTAPEFAAPTAERSVAENTAAGMDIGAAVAATDVDNDMLTYTLGGDDAVSFAIDAATGQLMTMAALDFETKRSYSVTVTASDGEEEATVMVTVMVTDVGLDNGYDVDDDGVISRAEAVTAVADFFDGLISREDTLAVVAAFFA